MFTQTWFYILIVVLLLVLGIIFVYLVLRKARRVPAPPEAELVAADGSEPLPAQLSIHASSVGLRLSFSKAMKRMGVYGKGSRYRIPWYLMLGETQSGKTTLLSNTGLDLLSDEPDEGRTGVKQGVNWFFFDQGIVLDVAGDFVLRADGGPSTVKGWNYLNKLIRSHRPERPLDGIILTIPATDLMPNPNPETKLKLERKADALYKKLLAAYETLGVNLPVYILVTKCDEVTGFTSLCQQIPRRRNEIFGWSSPYTREIAYRSEWVTEAFQNLYHYLFELQIEVFAERNKVTDNDELFMLPSGMRAMRPQLQIYLDQIFKESSYHDSFFLRGIYFCGDSTNETPASPLLLTAPEPEIDFIMPQPVPTRVITPPPPQPFGRKPAFLAHLFERKIFEEELLARPVSRTRLSRNRLVRVAQVLSLAIPIIGGLGILATYPGLRDREAEFYRYLTREEQDLKEIKTEKESGLNFEQARNREAHLFEAMANMNGKSLVSLFIPGSWFSIVNDNSRNSIISAYPYVVFDSLRRQLDYLTECKLVVDPNSAACYGTLPVSNQSNLISNCGDPSSGSVSTFIESLDELMQNRERYARLIQDESGNLDELNKLLLYLNHAPLPANFDARNALFVQAMKTPQRPALQTTDQSVYDRAACKVEGMIQVIYDRTFKDKSVTYGSLGDISKTEALLSRPGKDWLAKLANRVFEYPSPFEGMKFSEGITELKRALTDLSKEPFMTPESERQSESDDDDEPTYAHQTVSVLLWDKATLQQALQLYKEYDNFVTKKTYNRADTLDYSVKQAALTDFTRNFAALVRQSQQRQTSRPLPGESARIAGLRIAVKNFEDVQDLLSQLLNISKKLNIDVGLRRKVIGQLVSLMGSVDAEFNASDFYALAQPDFSWWTLNNPLQPYTAFGASNPDELEAYLAKQREGIAELARQYAKPLLDFMAEQNASLPSGSVNWNEILDQLNKYDAKKPGTTVAALENFIRDMSKININNCSVLSADRSYQPLDYFIEVRNSLRQLLYVHCQELSAEKLRLNQQAELESERLAREEKEKAFYKSLKNYTDIESLFNANLACKFPFSDLPQAEPFEEADPEDVNTFFELLDKNKAAARAVLEQCPDYGISPYAAQDFLNQMEKVQTFFASFLGKKPVYPVFDLTLSFRVNEDREDGANQIIDWSFDIGKKRIGYQDADKTGSWGFSDPLVLTLRWADDAPTVPSSKISPLSHMKVNQKTVTLLYNNNWSLLLLILKHKGLPTDYAQLRDIEPNTLKITVPTEPNAVLPNNVQQAQPANLKTLGMVGFMRVGLTAPGKKDPLILPAVFPKFAPELTNRNQSLDKAKDRCN